MAITSYSELQTAVANWLDRSDLTSRIPEFIALAEARHRRDIRTRSMQTRAQATLTIDSRYIALPEGFLSMRSLVLLTTPVTHLTQVSPDKMREVYWETSSGKPRFFAVHEEIEFNRPPDSTYTAEMLYWKQFTALSDTDTQNSLLTNHPGAYLFAALLEAELFNMNDERASAWEQRYQQVLDQIRDREAKDQWSQGPQKVAFSAVAF